jgi:hypothetical protein
LRVSLFKHGLSHSTVNFILQDRYGFTWFGTDDGLNKYDGHGFTVYKHNPGDPHSLSHNQNTSLHRDQIGTLWVGTVDWLGYDWHLGVRNDQGIEGVNPREIIKRK